MISQEKALGVIAINRKRCPAPARLRLRKKRQKIEKKKKKNEPSAERALTKLHPEAQRHITNPEEAPGKHM